MGCPYNREIKKVDRIFFLKSEKTNKTCHIRIQNDTLKHEVLSWIWRKSNKRWRWLTLGKHFKSVGREGNKQRDEDHETRVLKEIKWRDNTCIISVFYEENSTKTKLIFEI